jgi:hypothetical protein
MTKAIRVENADTSDWKVIVQTWRKNTPGPDTLVMEKELNHPAAIGDFTIFDSQYLVIKENGHSDYQYRIK